MHEDDLGELVGPFHDAAGVALLLGIDEAAVGQRLASGDILACDTSEGVTLFPVFQFTGGQVDPALLPAVRLLADSPRWGAALWFVTPNDELDDLTPIDWAAASRTTDAITRAAGHMARVWAA